MQIIEEILYHRILLYWAHVSIDEFSFIADDDDSVAVETYLRGIL